MSDQFTGLTPGHGGGAEQPDGRFRGGPMAAPGDMRQPYKWKCPTCQTEHVTPLEHGCPNCRVNFPETPKQVSELPEDRLRQAILRHPESQYAAGSLRAGGLTRRARRTLYLALSAFSEQAPDPHGLTRDELISWARMLSRAEEDELARSETK